MKALLLAVAITSLAGSAFAQCEHGLRSEEVGRIPSTFVINYEDGTKENMVIRYVGQASLNVSQSGSSSTWNHPVDSRRCSWSTEATVTRQLCIVSKSLGEQCEGNLTQVFYITGGGHGKSFNPFKADLQGENCNRACGKFVGDYNAAKKAVSDSMNGIFNEDFKPFLEQVKQKPGIQSISSQ